jgi:thioredoxin-related protein
MRLLLFMIWEIIMRKKSRLFIAVLLLTSIASATTQGWTTDVNRARRQAASQKKDVLINVTGSDWCGFCIRLHDKVFAQDLFIKEAPKHFVMVEMDFPRGEEKKAAQSEELKKQNTQWKKKLKSRGYPTVFLVDSKGVPYAKKVGYSRENPKEYLEILKRLKAIRVERDKNLKLAFKAKDSSKALEFLDKSLSCMETEMIINHYPDLVKKIIKQDSDNRLGLQRKYQNLPKIIDLKNKISVAQRKKDLAEIDLLVEKLLKLAGSKGSDAQNALFQQGYALRKSQPKSAKKAFENALAADPKGKLVTKIKSYLRRL